MDTIRAQVKNYTINKINIECPNYLAVYYICFLSRTLRCHLLLLVPCKWSEWFETSCSASCGNSSFKNMTRKIIQKAAYDGEECIGEAFKTEKCNVKPCPSK